jgi:aspartate/methionine/tyrosine aminotransferase
MEVLKELVGPRTKMVVVNFPHNPTGATLSREEQEELIRTVADVGAYLVWDGAFAELTYDASPLPDPVLQYDRALSMGTLSKAYGLPGLRVGWCLGSPEVLEKFARLRDYTILHLSPLVELLARHVIEKAEVLVSRRLETARRNRERLGAWIEEHRDHVEWVPPAGGVCSFVRFRGDLDVEELCHLLAREYRVLLVPGSCFHAPEHARLGFGGSPEELERGLEALSRVLRSRRSSEER